MIVKQRTKQKKIIYPVECPYYVKPKVTITNVRNIGKTNSRPLKKNEFRVCLYISITKNTRKWIPLTDYNKEMICKKKEWNRKTGMFKDEDIRNRFVRKVILSAYQIIINYTMEHKYYDHELFMENLSKKLKKK